MEKLFRAVQGIGVKPDETTKDTNVMREARDPEENPPFYKP